MDKYRLSRNTRHLSAGLDLSSAQDIFMLELIWDLWAELQILIRAHQIGAKQDLYVERLAMRDSVELEILRDLEKKQKGQAEVEAMNAKA